MNSMARAANAYQAAAAHRSMRDQEAEVFLRANAGLRAAKEAGPLARVRALADNNRVWIAATDLLRDPANALPEDLRASMISVGMAVQREMRAASPDFDFLIGVNENIASGLSARP